MRLALTVNYNEYLKTTCNYITKHISTSHQCHRHNEHNTANNTHIYTIISHPAASSASRPENLMNGTPQMVSLTRVTESPIQTWKPWQWNLVYLTDRFSMSYFDFDLICYKLCCLLSLCWPMFYIFARVADMLYSPTVALVLPLPNPNDPRQHEACCPLCKQPELLSLRQLLMWQRKKFQFADHGGGGPRYIFLNEKGH